MNLIACRISSRTLPLPCHSSSFVPLTIADQSYALSISIHPGITTSCASTYLITASSLADPFLHPLHAIAISFLLPASLLPSTKYFNDTDTESSLGGQQILQQYWKCFNIATNTSITQTQKGAWVANSSDRPTPLPHKAQSWKAFLQVCMFPLMSCVIISSQWRQYEPTYLTVIRSQCL